MRGLSEVKAYKHTPGPTDPVAAWTTVTSIVQTLAVGTDVHELLVSAAGGLGRRDAHGADQVRAACASAEAAEILQFALLSVSEELPAEIAWLRDDVLTDAARVPVNNPDSDCRF